MWSCWHYSPDPRVLGRLRVRGQQCAGPRKENPAVMPNSFHPREDLGERLQGDWLEQRPP